MLGSNHHEGLHLLDLANLPGMCVKARTGNFFCLGEVGEKQSLDSHLNSEVGNGCV